MKNYNFTQNWFYSYDLEQFLPLGTQDEIHILEIGSFEGESAVWFSENLLNNKNSTITCIDPWISYHQKNDSLNSYNKDILKEDLSDLSEGYIFSNEYETFVKNIIETNKLTQIHIMKGLSDVILPNLIFNQKKYDIIFIDGNHTSPYVLSDAIMSWKLLKVNGTMVFDDYLWGLDKHETLRPKMAVDNFISNYSDYLEVCWSDYRIAVKKIK
jgi:predicted O-methyltransferase YrrM